LGLIFQLLWFRGQVQGLGSRVWLWSWWAAYRSVKAEEVEINAVQLAIWKGLGICVGKQRGSDTREANGGVCRTLLQHDIIQALVSSFFVKGEARLFVCMQRIRGCVTRAPSVGAVDYQTHHFPAARISYRQHLPAGTLSGPGRKMGRGGERGRV
jgi:hypothetical protein